MFDEKKIVFGYLSGAKRMVRLPFTNAGVARIDQCTVVEQKCLNAASGPLEAFSEGGWPYPQNLGTILAGYIENSSQNVGQAVAAIQSQQDHLQACDSEFFYDQLLHGFGLQFPPWLGPIGNNKSCHFIK
jgi:hypothetical protein